MEQTGPARLAGFGYAPYSMGGAHNTWHGVSIVDADGKEVPWVDAYGNQLDTVDQRFLPGKGQRFNLGAGIGITIEGQDYRTCELARDLPERIHRGEFKLPLYADLTRLSALERRCIFGMMLGNEGKTRIPIYETFTKAGFDPDKDMLQAPVALPESYQHANFWSIAAMGSNLRSAHRWRILGGLESAMLSGRPICGRRRSHLRFRLPR